MSKISHIKTSEARSNPEAAFKSPAELAATRGLTTGEKIAAIDRWIETVEQRLDATAEGMPASGNEANDAELLRNLSKMRDELIK